MLRASSFRLATIILPLLILPALVAAQTPPSGSPAPDGLIAADADQRQFPPLLDLPPTAVPQTATPPMAVPAGADESWQTWSRVAYRGFDGDDYELYTLPPGTGHVHKLTDTPAAEAQPAISPDARRLAFVADYDGDFDLFLMDYTVDGPTGYVTHLLNTPGNEYWPVWSPDGSRLAFYSFVGDQAEVYTIRADGSGLTRLTENAAFDGYPTWSPDGTRLAFTSTRSGGYRIYVMNSDGSGLRQLSSQSGSLFPTWSPDGRRIAYSADPDNDGWLDAMMMNADGSDQHILLNLEAEQDVQLRSWSPDSQAVAYTWLTYISYYGQWYIEDAVTKAVYVVENVYGPSNLASSYSFEPYWTKIDLLAPETAVVPLPAESPYTFTVHWGGDDRGPAGVEAYEVQVRENNGPWTDWEIPSSLTDWPFAGRGGVTYAFRSRGRDFAGNVEPWPAVPDAVTRVESRPPRTTLTPLPAWTRQGHTITATWRGYDPGGSEIETYQAQYRRNAEVWTDLPWPVGTQTELNLQDMGVHSGDRFSFRVRAVDRAQNVEPWPADDAGATTTVFERVLTGQVTDNTGTPVIGAAAELTPSSLIPAASGPDGRYSAYFGPAPASLSARLGKAGYGTLPPAVISLVGDAALLTVLPPADDVVANGGFEAADWGAWQVDGSRPPALTATGHSGAAATLGEVITPLSARQRLSDTPSLAEYDTRLMLDGAGNVFVLWRTHTGSGPGEAGPLYGAIRRADGQWLNAVKLRDNVYQYDVAVDGAGQLHVAASVLNDKVYLLPGSGAGWSAAEAVPNSARAWMPFLTAGPDGRLDLVFENQQGRLLHLRRAGNGTWATPTDMGQGVGGVGETVVGTDGTLHFFYPQSPGVMHRFLPPGGIWSAAQMVADNTSWLYYRLAVASDGSIYLGWIDGMDWEASRLKARVLRGSQWGPEEMATPLLTEGDELLGWAVGPDGQPQALIGQQQSLIYVRREAGGWSEPHVRALGAHYAMASMTVDAAGAPHVAYMDEADSGVYNVFYTMRASDGRWTTPANLSQSGLWGHDGLLAVDPLGNVHVIWQFSSEKSDPSFRLDDVGYAGPLPGTVAAGNTTLTQEISIPADMAHPTLSFFYTSVGALELTIDSPGRTATAVTLSPSPAGMRHHWLPLDGLAGEEMTIRFALTQPANAPAVWATIDEVSLGAAHADVWVTAESTRGAPGQTVRHTLRLGNRGAVAATGVTLTYTLPPELSFVSASRPPSGLAPLRWDIGALPPGGAPLVIELTAAARPDAIGRTVSSTAALVAADELEVLNNTAVARTPLESVVYLPSAMGRN